MCPRFRGCSEVGWDLSLGKLAAGMPTWLPIPWWNQRCGLNAVQALVEPWLLENQPRTWVKSSDLELSVRDIVHTSYGLGQQESGQWDLKEVVLE